MTAHTAQAGEGQSERDRVRIPSKFHAVSTEPNKL